MMRKKAGIDLLQWSTLLLILLFLVCGCVQPAGQANTESAVPISIPTNQQPTPTPTPKPTPLPMVDASLAVLGGSVNTFDNKFGDNNCCHENGWDISNPSMQVSVWYDSYINSHQRFIDQHSTERVRGIRLASLQCQQESQQISYEV
jgi:hypothetical protein